jgi:uncharacterized protein (TIGR02265 family)
MEIAGSIFEGLFIRALKVRGPICQRLAAVGFDCQKMEPTYPVDVWRKSVQVAATEYYPTLPLNEAQFQLGSRMLQGYLETLVGKVIAAAMPFLSADTLCKRLPRLIAGGNKGMTPPTVTYLEPGHYQLTLFGEQSIPWFTAGTIDASLRANRVTPQVVVKSSTLEQTMIDIRWA